MNILDHLRLISRLFFIMVSSTVLGGLIGLNNSEFLGNLKTGSGIFCVGRLAALYGPRSVIFRQVRTPPS